ncbi:MAG TPA: dTMP kinase, partial [Candidatus Cybelea sp.]|nr:dTMP kinase [Candidatus Cybelea sp.]
LVLCDRFIDSTIAYQGYGRGLDLAALRELCVIAAGNLQPDLTLLLDVPVEAAFARLPERATARDRIEREDAGFHERVRRGFLAIAGALPDHRILDGTQSPAAVFDAALGAIHGLLGEPVS